MAESRRTNVRIDPDGVRIIETAGVRRRVWLLAAAVVALALVFLWLRMGNNDNAPEQRMNTEREVAAAAEAPRRAQPPKFRPVRRSDEPPDAPPRAPAEGRGQRTSEPAEAAGTAPADSDEDAPTGIALFPPPGTDPIKRGLIVPEDFELPPGYVRHYQATDDGQRLPAILMFHPDYDWVDANGEPVEVPPDHIVPPELAPAGLPLQTLDVPEVIVPMIEEPGAGEAAD